VRTKVGEYFGLVDPTEHVQNHWDILPDERPVLVWKYIPLLGSGRAVLEVVTKRFRRDSLVLSNTKTATRKEVAYLFSKSNEEDSMSNATQIIELAKTGDKAATEEALKSSLGQAVKRALFMAERKNEFLAIPVLQELSIKYGVTKAKKTELTEKEGKVVTLTKDGKVDSRVFDAILKKANKVGAVTATSGKGANLIIRNQEADAFIKACKMVVGITVS